ncbi:MAG: glycosyltransferase family 4 protein [Oscillospiraceae bacterium]|nr:glycosyltransferase family 4 protein [Oscillospiraceae bacterium]
MKILLIDYDAGSESLGGDSHAYDLAVAWKKNGAKTLIAAADYSYLRQKNLEKAPTGRISEQDGVSFLWIKTPAAADREKKILRGAWPFEKGLRRSLPVIADWKPDAVLLSSRHLLGIRGGLQIAKKLDLPLVFDVRRVYPEHLQEVLEYAPGHYLIRLFRQAQKTAYRKSSRVLSIYPALGEHMAALGCDPKAFIPVPQALSPSLIQEHKAPQRHIDFVCRYREKGNFICLAGGDIEKDQELELLIEAAALAPRDVLFVLVGNGIFKPNLKREVKQRALSNVLFLDGVHPQQLVDVYQAADCVYVGLPAYQWHRYGADTTRVLLAMESGVPVLCAADIPENPVESAKCGSVVPPGDPQALIQALEALRKLPQTERQALGERGKDYVAQYAQIGHQAQGYLGALQDAVAERTQKT